MHFSITSKQKKFILITLGSIVFLFASLINDAQLLIISLFLLVWGITPDAFSHETTQHISKKVLFFQLFVLSLLAGEITEFFAVLSNLHLPPDQRILFFPDPLKDMVVSLAYYLPIGGIIAMLFLFLNLDHKLIFALGGIYGIITEQDGAILLTPNLFLWTYVFLVYGSYVALPAFALRAQLKQIERKGKQWTNALLFEGSLLMGFYILARLAMAGMFILLGKPF